MRADLQQDEACYFQLLQSREDLCLPQIKASKSSQCATPHLFQLLETSRDHTTSQCWTPELELLYNLKFTENIDLKKWVNKDCVILIECESFLGHQQAVNKELLGPGLLLQLFQP